MGLFHKRQSQKPTEDEAADAEQHFFDEYFREELRNHGRWYFEKVIKENGELFKQDLDATITRINNELQKHISEQLDVAIGEIKSEFKGYVTRQLDERLAEYGKATREAQDMAVRSLNQTVQGFHEQHRQLGDALQKTISEQEQLVTEVFEENAEHVADAKKAQAEALQLLGKSVEELQAQHQRLGEMLQQSITNQEQMLTSAFKDNMARVVEHYLLGALGDQYDMKAQLPSIIQQLEENKQAMVDDMKL